MKDIGDRITNALVILGFVLGGITLIFALIVLNPSAFAIIITLLILWGILKEYNKEVNKLNLNVLAVDIAKKEKGKVEVNIGQIKEILKITLELLGKYSNQEIIKTINRYR